MAALGWCQPWHRDSPTAIPIAINVPLAPKPHLGRDRQELCAGHRALGQTALSCGSQRKRNGMHSVAGAAKPPNPVAAAGGLQGASHYAGVADATQGCQPVCKGGSHCAGVPNSVQQCQPLQPPSLGFGNEPVLSAAEQQLAGMRMLPGTPVPPSLLHQAQWVQQPRAAALGDCCCVSAPCAPQSQVSLSPHC